MLEEIPREELFAIIAEIEQNPAITQRLIAEKLGISLGKTNYLLKALINKGLIKAKSFSANPRKLERINYILTKKGLEEKMHLMYHFLKKKEAEYNRLKEEWGKLAMGRVKKSALTI
jgi:EPS-associated MarR family transcriptional regulator